MRGAVAPAWVWIKPPDAVAHGLDFGHRLLQAARHAGRVARGQRVQVAVQNAPGQLARLRAGDCRQLQQQAFADVARAHAGRPQRLHVPQGNLQFLQARRRVEFARVKHVRQQRAQVAVLVQRLHQRAGQKHVAQRQLEQASLGRCGCT